MIKYNQYGITADTNGYTIGVVRPRIKDGKEEEYLSNAKYYGDLSSAIRGLMEFERRRITAEAQALGELLEAVRKSDNAILEALLIKTA